MKKLIPVALLLLAACGTSSDGGAPLGVGNTVKGVVNYDGAVTGPLRVAVFPSFPPRGAPLAEQWFDAPAYPQAYELTNVPAGRWFVLAIVDADPDDGDRFHPLTDAGGAFGSYLAPQAVSITAQVGAQAVDVSLVDPSPTSPWGRYH